LVFLILINAESGKVVIVLQGRHAGKKAVVVKAFDDSSSADKRYAHCLIAGIDRHPRKITKSMTKKKIEKRSKMKPFVKYVNVRHVFPTRYVVDMDLKKTVEEESLATEDGKIETKKALKKIFEERYLNQKAVTSEKKAVGSNYFFQKLQF
jgi:large subunit ribosomal protein L27e